MPTLRSRLFHALHRRFPPQLEQAVQPAAHATFGATKAASTMGRYLEELPSWRIDVLDYGCRAGGETFWLAAHVQSVVGVDIDAESIAVAQATAIDRQTPNLQFLWSRDGTIPCADRSFDAVLSTDTFEHVMDLDRAFREIARVLRPGGHLISRFGPLFYSPYGYHMQWACHVPWGHLIGGLDGILALRAEKVGPDPAMRTWQDTGLNAKRFRDFQTAIRRAGLRGRVRRIPVAHLAPLAVLPLVGELFTFGVDLHVRRPH